MSHNWIFSSTSSSRSFGDDDLDGQVGGERDVFFAIRDRGKPFGPHESHVGTADRVGIPLDDEACLGGVGTAELARLST